MTKHVCIYIFPSKSWSMNHLKVILKFQCMHDTDKIWITFILIIIFISQKYNKYLTISNPVTTFKCENTQFCYSIKIPKVGGSIIYTNLELMIPKPEIQSSTIYYFCDFG